MLNVYIAYICLVSVFYMSGYVLNKVQHDYCFDAIRRSGLPSNEVDKYLKYVKKPGSDRTVSFYLALQVFLHSSRKFSMLDRKFVDCLPKPISKYLIPRDMLDVLIGPVFYKKSEFPNPNLSAPDYSDVTDRSSESVTFPGGKNVTHQVEGGVSASSAPRSAKKLYSFHIDPDQLDQLRKRADQDGRSVAGTLRFLVRRYLDSNF